MVPENPPAILAAMRRATALLAAMSIVLSANVLAQEPPESPHPYDERADPQFEVESAVRIARRQDKRVLLVFGANWCVWCRRLDYTLRHEPRVVAALRRFLVVHVDTGRRGSGKAAALDTRYGHPTAHGLPVIVVLDGDGEVVMTQDTGALESGDHHDPDAILAFLTRAGQPQTH
jgi:thiol:disulfide interchange protein